VEREAICVFEHHSLMAERRAEAETARYALTR